MITNESEVEKDSQTYEGNGNFKENKINFSKEVKQVIDKVSSIFWCCKEYQLMEMYYS